MYKLVYASKAEQEDFEKKYGRYNYAPPNLKEITQDEFFRALDCSPVAVSYKQIMPSNDIKELMSLHMYIFNDGSGVGYTNDWNPKNGLDCWEQTFYSFAVCVHDYKCTLSRMCYAEYRCTKCGHQHSVDSSD